MNVNLSESAPIYSLKIQAKSLALQKHSEVCRGHCHALFRACVSCVCCFTCPLCPLYGSNKSPSGFSWLLDPCCSHSYAKPAHPLSNHSSTQRYSSPGCPPTPDHIQALKTVRCSLWILPAVWEDGRHLFHSSVEKTLTLFQDFSDWNVVQ